MEITFPENDDQDRVKYTGLWKNNAPSGFGKMTWKSGATYEGNWVFGKREGLGEYVYQELKDRKVFRGKWIDDQKTDVGILKWKNGDEYFGEFELDEMTGNLAFFNLWSEARLFLNKYPTLFPYLS